jgi:hypothetical protein
MRSFRCPDELWEQAKDKSREIGVSVTDVLIAALDDFIDSP